MTINKNYKDIAVRFAKTFLQAALGVLLVQSGMWLPAVLVGLISATASAVMNLFNVSPTSVWGRALATFVQTFLATFAATGYVITEAGLMSAFAAAIAATMNFIKESA